MEEWERMNESILDAASSSKGQAPMILYSQK